MKLYLAARHGRREEMQVVADLIRGIGHHVTSRWLDGLGDSEADNALYDLTDIVVADALILYTEEPTGQVPFAARGGRHVEFGYALRAGKRLFIVGPRENIFHQLENVVSFANTEELIDKLDEIAPDYEGDDI